MFTKQIVFFGQEAIVGCDRNCEKAWGINSRPKIEEDGEVFFKSDSELGEAPRRPGTSEGGVIKPTNSKEYLNKWCVRECERSCINECGTPPIEENLILPDFSQRVKL